MSNLANYKAFLNSKKALLINFTGDSYHWGCYGTSMEIYQTLLDKNYYIEIISVFITHNTSPTVEKIDDFDDPQFFQQFQDSNPSLIQSIYKSDVIIVNGEGTLHRISKASLNLLYFMFISKKYFGKKVHLINFSCFPNGDTSKPAGASLIYPSVLQHIDLLAPREKITSKILRYSDLKGNQSFDCLPRFLSRHNLTNSHKPCGNILVTGGVSFQRERYDMLKNFISFFLKKSVDVVFLSGAHFSPANEDLILQKMLSQESELTGLRIVEAKTMVAWIDEFKKASFLFSARFHHSIAALSIGTPFKFLSSNTPKITAAIQTINESEKDYHINDNDYRGLRDAAMKALSNPVSIKSQKRIETMLSLASNNFINL